MKKIILSFIIGLLTFPLICDLLYIVNYRVDSKIVDALYTKSITPSYGVSDIFNENCTKDKSRNGHGWKFINREYYQCNKLQIAISDLLFGERTKLEHKPKFKVGDCVVMYNFEPFKIYEIMENDYGVVLDATCTEEDRVMCGSSSPYDIENVDKEGTKVECPNKGTQ